MASTHNSGTPRISVCMATYNGAAFLHQQLESICPQLSDSDEIVISDDNSTDETVEIIETFTGVTIRLIKKKGAPGVTSNFNNALSHARGEYIFLADQDDVWNTGRIAAAMNELQKHMLVLCDCELIDESGQKIAPSLFKRRSIGYRGFWQNLLRNSYTGCAMAFHRKLLDTALPLPSTIPMYDWWLGLVAERKGTVAIVNKPLVKYRIHGKNVSPTGTGSTYHAATKLIFRLHMLTSLFVRLYVRRPHRT